MCGAVQLLAGGSVKIDSAVALGPKADLGIHFQPNPLVVMHEYGIRSGVGTGPWSWAWLLLGRRGDSWPPVG